MTSQDVEELRQAVEAAVAQHPADADAKRRRPLLHISPIPGVAVRRDCRSEFEAGKKRPVKADTLLGGKDRPPHRDRDQKRRRQHDGRHDHQHDERESAIDSALAKTADEIDVPFHARNMCQKEPAKKGSLVPRIFTGKKWGFSGVAGISPNTR